MDELYVHESGDVHVSLLVFQVGNLRGPGGGPLASERHRYGLGTDPYSIAILGL